MFHVSQIMEVPLSRLSQSIKNLQQVLRNNRNLGILLLFSFLLSCNPNEVFDALVVDSISLNTTDDVYGLAILNEDKIVVVGGRLWDKGFASISTDAGAQWKTDSLYNKALLAIDHKDEVVVASGIEGNHFFYQNETWLKRPTGSYEHVKDLVLLDDSTSLSLGGGSYQDGFIFEVPLNNSVETLFRSESELKSLAQVNDTTLVAVGFGVVLTSSNRGIDWSLLDISGDYFQDVFFVNDQVGFILGNDGSLYKTIDGAINWTQLKTDNLLSSEGLRSLYSSDANVIWIVGNRGLVLYSDDGGLNWKEKNIEGVGDLYDIDGYNDLIVAVGSAGGVFKLSLK